MKRIIGLCCGLSLALGLLAWASLEAQDGLVASADAEAPGADARAARRSFTGAPPTIPHKVFRKDNKECLHCHLSVRKTPFGISNITPHSEFRNCQQCHVGTQNLNDGLVVPQTPNTFEGWVDQTKGYRAHELAPPTVPHTLWLRQNCNSCHAADQPAERPRGPHPKRRNCRQCHVQENPEF